MTTLPTAAGRAAQTRTGHPVLKLVLLVVATLPGWPVAADITAAAEQDPVLTAFALTELERLGLLVVYRHGGDPRYGLAESDEWGHVTARASDDPPPSAPVEQGIDLIPHGRAAIHPAGQP